jgi:tetratricopeptide (TPR) repeat protein
MKLTTTVLNLFFSLSIGYGQKYMNKFQELCAKNDTIKQRELLVDWENKQPNDPELYVASFNYFFTKAKKSYIGIQDDVTNKEGIKIQDTTGQTVGFMAEVTHFDPEEIEKGFTYINKGISKFPNRLDMRFGKVFVLGKLERYEDFTTEIIKTIEYGQVNNNAWLWSNNEKKNDGKESLLSPIQSYVLQLYNTNNDGLLDNMKRISETILKYYPNHIESLSNVSIVYMIKNENNKALEVLLKAEQINTKDYIILGNIAQAYKKLGDKKNSIKYYKKCLKYGDKQSIQYAKEQIEILEKK